MAGGIHRERARRYRQGGTEEKLAAKLEKVTERLQADAPNMERPGADLIAHYLDPDRLPVEDRWSRKHAHTQRRLCERFAAPVIDAITCQDVKTDHMQQIVNAAPGGVLLVVHHPTPSKEQANAHGFNPDDYVSPADVAALIDDRWRIEVNETRHRNVTTGAGSAHTQDIVLRARRLT